MSNGPVSLPHLSLHRSQEQLRGDPGYQGLPPLQKPQPNYYAQYTREGNCHPESPASWADSAKKNAMPSSRFFNSDADSIQDML